MIKHGESALSLYLKCQVPLEKPKIDLTKKICLVLGISSESASITNGIAKTLSQAGAKVYIAPSQNNKSAKKWPEIEQPYRNENVITIKDFIREHSNHDECDIQPIFDYIEKKEDGKLDILVNNFYDYDYLKTSSLKNSISIHDDPIGWENIVNQNNGLTKLLMSSVFSSRMMEKNRSGLIINVHPTRNDLRELNCLSRQIETSSSEEITSTISIELKNSNVSILSLMIDAADITRKNADSFEHIGLAISHLASDSLILKKSGKTFTTRCLAKEYNLKDVDGIRRDEYLDKMIDSVLIPCWLRQILDKLSLSHAKFGI